MEVKQLLKDKKFWFASFLIAWAAALQVKFFDTEANISVYILKFEPLSRSGFVSVIEVYK